MVPFHHVFHSLTGRLPVQGLPDPEAVRSVHCKKVPNSRRPCGRPAPWRAGFRKPSGSCRPYRPTPPQWRAPRPPALRVCRSREKILLKGGQGVGRAFFLDEARFRQTHEIFAGTAETITAGAERGNEFVLSEIGNHFREGVVIAKLKLCRLELAGFLIATRIGTAARRNLGNAEFQRPLPDSRFFPSGHDNARVRHGKAQYGDKLARSRCTAAGRPNPTRWPVRCGTLMVCQPTPNRSSRCAMWAMSANVSNRQSYKPVEQPHAHVVDARLHGTVE